MAQRLPVYLLLDVSASMAGEPIEALRQGVRALQFELSEDPQAARTAWVSVIAFGSGARQLTPLTALSRFRAPSLEVEGTSALGAALRLLDRCIEREVVPPREGEAGDFLPMAFLLTDGAPTDEWRDAAGTLVGRVRLVACGAGARADMKTLRELAPDALALNSLSAGALAEYFSFVSARVRETAGSAGGGEIGWRN